MVNITEQRLAQLEDIEAKMNALERGGVDNWEWYSEALKDYNAKKQEEESFNNLVDEICESLITEIEEPAGSGSGYGIRKEGLAAIKKIIKRFIAEQQNLTKGE